MGFNHRLWKSAEVEGAECSSASNPKDLGDALALTLSKASTLQGTAISKTSCDITGKWAFPKKPRNVFLGIPLTFFNLLCLPLCSQRSGFEVLIWTYREVLSPFTKETSLHSGRKEKPSDYLNSYIVLHILQPAEDIFTLLDAEWHGKSLIKVQLH